MVAPICTDGFEWDPAKCARNLARHGINFQDAILIWQGPVLQRRSDRAGEARFIAFGFIRFHLIAVVWTPRGGTRRIISARKAHRHEREQAHALLGRPAPGAPDGTPSGTPSGTH